MHYTSVSQILVQLYCSVLPSKQALPVQNTGYLLPRIYRQVSFNFQQCRIRANPVEPGLSSTLTSVLTLAPLCDLFRSKRPSVWSFSLFPSSFYILFSSHFLFLQIETPVLPLKSPPPPYTKRLKELQLTVFAPSDESYTPETSPRSRPWRPTPNTPSSKGEANRYSASWLLSPRFLILFLLSLSLFPLTPFPQLLFLRARSLFCNRESSAAEHQYSNTKLLALISRRIVQQVQQSALGPKE